MCLCDIQLCAAEHMHALAIHGRCAPKPQSAT
jgi:hypothetical protein